jgi:hypothetical protein
MTCFVASGAWLVDLVNIMVCGRGCNGRNRCAQAIRYLPWFVGATVLCCWR